MTPLSLLLLFVTSFGSVFLLGIQSKNVNQGRYLASVVTSFGISVGQFTFAHAAASGTLSAFFASAAGGCCGIAASIGFYQRFMEKTRNESA
jgi:uncharacterized membrane protein YjjB (DUF3815 family)